MSSVGIVLDAGAFIAAERRDETMAHVIRGLHARRVPLVTSAAVVAQVWRGGGASQTPIAFLLRRTEVVDLTQAVARTLGRMLARSRTSDPIDAHVVWLAATRGWPVLTSDAADLRAVDPNVVVRSV